MSTHSAVIEVSSVHVGRSLDRCDYAGCGYNATHETEATVNGVWVLVRTCAEHADTFKNGNRA